MNARKLSGLTAALWFVLTSHSAIAEQPKDPYATPKEDFSVAAIKQGYSLKDAIRLHNEWNLKKFLDITEAGAYSYLHLPEFLPHALVHRDGQVAELPYEVNKAIGQISVTKGDKTTQLTQTLNAKGSPLQGLLVVRNGKIVYEAYPGMRKTDRHVWMSNAKVVAGLLVAMLEEEGLIDVQQPVVHYVPKAKGSAWEQIKIIDLLNMQTGLDLEENPATRSGDTPYNKFVRAEAGLPARDGKMYTHNEALLSIPKLGEPGKKFEYSSAITQMIGLVLEEVTQKRLAELIAEKIWRKAGMAGDATLTLTPQGNGIIHGLISSRLDDMARFGMLFTPSQQTLTDQPIVTPATLQKINTLGMSENFMKGTLGPLLAKKFGEEPKFNAYQWDAVFEDGDLFKGGMNGQGLYVSPSRDTVIVWFATGFTDVPMEAFAREISLSFSK